MWTAREVEGLADERSIGRGWAYQREGRVEIQRHEGDTVRAIVRGTMPYLVELRAGDRRSWSCTCPVGESGDFCKHCVAVALEISSASAEARPPSSAPDRQELPASEPEGVDLRTYLHGLDAEELVELLVVQAKRDPRLRQALEARAVISGGGSLDVGAWKRRIDSAFGGDGYVYYGEAEGWAAAVFELLASLDDLVHSGHAAAVVGLAERAHRAADEAVQYVDDSDGWISTIAEQISDLHLRACDVARPDPVELAGRLAALELSSELDTFHRAAATYADVLGEEGIAAYRAAVEPAWRAATTRRADPFSHGVFAATQAMVGVAHATGDPDELIAIRGADVRTPDDHLEIARLLAEAGRDDEAVEWARRGLDEFADRPWQTPPLRDFLAARLRARGDATGAEALWWEAFERHPSLEGYRTLLAESADAEARRSEATDLLRRRLEAGDTEAGIRNPRLQRSPPTTLVEILLYEGEADEAWSAAAAFGCDDRMWMTLARAREKLHPLDAIPIYERAVWAQIETKKNGGYRAAVDLLSRIRTCADEGGEPQRFTDLLGDVTERHARKRNLMAMIDGQGWT